MAKLVVHGTSLSCTMGVAPCNLTIVPHVASRDDAPAATVKHYLPVNNIAGFGMCQALANPQVASATSAAQGVLTPQPCVPVISTPWLPGSKVVTIDDVPALTADSTTTCQWSGLITISDPGGDVTVD